MKDMKLRLLAISASALFGTFVCAAQGYEGLRDFEYVKATTPVLNLSNPAALAGWDGKISQAAVRFDKANGGLASLTQSKDSYEVAAGTESFYRISDKIAFYGNIDWSYFNGKEMGGPILIDPEYNPVNFYELDETTLGTKKTESYSLKGALSYSFNDRWAAGLTVKFDGRDQTKVKDPRFLNYWTDLSFDAGVSFRPSSSVLLGASAFYRNTLETVQGGIYGKTDQSYFFLVDRGNYFGTVAELVGTRAELSPSDKRPMNNNLFGGAIQMAVGDQYYGEVTFTARDGYYGRKSSGSAVFYQFAGYEIRYDGALVVSLGKSTHRIGFSAGYSYLFNNENTFNYVTPIGGVTKVEYTGKRFVMDKTVLDGGLSYRWFYGGSAQRPDLTVGADAKVYSKTQHSEIYPFYRDQKQTNRDFVDDVDVFVKKDIRLGEKSLVNVGVHGMYHAGFAKFADAKYTEATSSVIRTFDVWSGPQTEYDTAARAGGLVSVEWIPILKKAMTPYVRISDSYMTLLKDPTYLKGKTRNVASLSVGIVF